MDLILSYLKHLAGLLISSFLFGILTVQSVTADSLSPIEKQITQSISQKNNEQLSFLEKLVNINSGTNNMTGITKIGEMLRAEFEQLGFKTYWVYEPSSMHRAGTLIAERNGMKGKRLLLIGHLDTVFAANSPFQHFKRQSNIAIGPGVGDDKGGDVIILYALKALEAAHALNDTTITVILTGDEEESGKPTSISRKPLFEAARHSDIALDFELALTSNTATIARRGITNWTLITTGKEAHSAGIFQNAAGAGAIFEMSRILNAMLTQLAGEKYLSFSPGIILGGTTVQYDKINSRGTAFGKENIIAKTAMVQGDLRFLTPKQLFLVEKKMNTIVKQHLPGTTAAIHFQSGIPGMLPTEQNLALLKIYSKASSDLGYKAIKPLDPGARGAGDISHIASMVSASLAGLGALGSDAHSTKEQLVVNALPMQTQRAALLIYRLSR